MCHVRIHACLSKLTYRFTCCCTLVDSGRDDRPRKVMAAFPEQEQGHNADTTCQRDTSCGQTRLIGDIAQDRFTDRQKQCCYQRLHGEYRRPDIAWHFILNAAQGEYSHPHRSSVALASRMCSRG
jgi:hypothetical protein